MEKKGKSTKFQAVTAGICLFASVCVPEVALAAFSLKLQTNAGTIKTIEDNGTGDTDPMLGSIVFNGSIDSFGVIVSTALSKPIVGDPTSAQLNMSAVSSTKATGGTLEISASDNGYLLIPPQGATRLISAVGGTTNKTSFFQTYTDSANTLFQTSGASVCTTGIQGPYSNGAFNNNAEANCSSNGYFSITAYANTTLNANQVQSFGYQVNVVPLETCAGKIGDLVWHDQNGNGLQDSGETGIAGASVTLKDAYGNIFSTTTDADGYYTFADVCAGTYEVDVDEASIDPIFTPTAANAGDDTKDSDSVNGQPVSVTLPANNSSDTTIDFGFVSPNAALGDRVWNDANINGVQDNGETGIAGATVNLRDCGGALIATATTDANGNYLFAGLAPGGYTVDFVNPDGSVWARSTADAGGDDSLDSDAGATGMTGCYTLAAGESNLTVDAGFYKKAALGDRVWNDANNNGVQDNGETGIAGATVNLRDCSGALIATTTTDANGNYLFAGLAPGSYTVDFVNPDGSVWARSTADAGGDDSLDSDAGATGMTGCYTLAAGESNLTVDAGFYKKAALGDRVWNDANNNGVQDNGETGIAGATVNLRDCSGALIATTTTDANGNYLFAGLAPGSYTVDFVNPDGSVWARSTADAGGDDSLDSDAGATGMTGCYTLAAGESNLTVDAGFYKKAALGDRVWNDANNNGVQDNGETGIAGATVNLRDCSGALIATTTTDANG
ncbi:MAG: SdrD B-like domain-containing protein, partial [Thermodesulfobacteriota bacterium]